MSLHARASAAPVQLKAPAALSRIFQSRTLWCVVAVALFGIQSLNGSLADLRQSLGDPDDASRLLFVREWLAGANWFDPTTTRMGGPTPLQSHWSRLVDAPIGAIIWTTSLFVDAAQAEMTARILWPLIVLTVLMRILVRETELKGATLAAVFALILSVTAVAGLFQFAPGRIDHHNMMILGAVGGLLMLTRIVETPKAGTPAGILLGLGLAIGYEPLALVGAAVGLAGLAALSYPSLRPGMVRASTALALTLAAIMVVTVRPDQYFNVACDALALNWIVLTAGGAIGLALLNRQPQHASWLRCLAVSGMPVLGGLAIYGALEPKCLAGPFGQMNPALRSIWLDHVHEGFNVFATFAEAPLPVLVIIAAMVVGGSAAAIVYTETRTADAAGRLVLMLVAIPLGLWQIKLAPYAIFIAVVTTSLWAARLPSVGQISAPSIRLMPILLFNQTTLAGIIAILMPFVGFSDDKIKASEMSGHGNCTTTPAVQALAALSPGLIVAERDLGPYIAALTGHNVLDAPYHRIDTAILAGEAIRDGDRSLAEQRLRAFGTTYVALCRNEAKKPNRQPGAALAGTLATELVMDRPIPYLQEVDISKATMAIRVWKLLPPSK